MPTDPYKYFRVEAQELLGQLGQGALDLEKGTSSGEVVARLLRLAHTLKGAARVVKQPQMAEHAHALEDLFAAFRDAGRQPKREEIDRMLQVLDQMGVLLAALTPGRAADAAAPGTVPAPDAVHVFRHDSADLERLVEGVGEAQAHLTALRPALEQSDRVRHLIDLVGDQLARLHTREARAAVPQTAVDKALSMVHELQGRFAALDKDITHGVDQLERQLRDVSHTAARLRLVPASTVFRFLERATRDVGQAVGKRVKFEGRGDVRVDAGVLTTVQGALLQLVRNAVAHGIECSVSERQAAGKLADGHVVVTVARRGALVAFSCADDGKGVDFDAVRRILQRKESSDRQRDMLDTEALLRRLLKGGITTSGSLTDVAGRGVGLDVVREAAERLAGDVTMESQPGKGTTVTLLVPATLSSFQALLVEAADVKAAVPLDAVRRTVRLRPGDVTATPGGHAILHAGKSVPLSSLRSVLGTPGHSVPSAGPSTAFVIEAEDLVAAFAVDRILETAEVVMRPLPEFAPTAPSVVGASLSAGGAPVLVLDPATLVDEARRLGPRTSEAPAQRPPVLVIDDSLTTRMLEQSILESAGYEVSVATSGEEGLEKARSATYSLFLVDVEMPGIDGFTFIERVRADPTLRATPAILITSRASAEDRQRGREVGAQGYIVKSEFDQGVLLDQIRALVH